MNTTRQEWLKRAEELALRRTRDMSFTEQNEFWLEYQKIFLPYSNLNDIVEFCGEQRVEPPFDPFVCMECGSEELQQDEGHADTICTACGTVQPWPITCNKHRLLEGQVYVRKKGYTPEDHMSCILTELQCGRSRDIQPIVDDVAFYLKQTPISFIAVRGCLRKLGYRQHYLMMPSILHGLNRHQFRPWTMERGALQRIQALFFQYKSLYENMDLKEKEYRKNHLNYHYLLVEICKLLNLHDIPFRFLHTPQGPKSIQQHERLWNKIKPFLILYQ